MTPSEARAAIERVKLSLGIQATTYSSTHAVFVNKADLSALLAVVEARGKALKPFAAVVGVIAEDTPDHRQIAWPQVAGAYRAAALAYSLTAETEGEDR